MYSSCSGNTRIPIDTSLYSFKYIFFYYSQNLPTTFKFVSKITPSISHFPPLCKVAYFLLSNGVKFSNTALK